MRYIRLYLYFLRFSFSKAMEFRLDFFFRIVMDCTFYAVNLAFFTILYDHGPSMGNLSLDDIYIFVTGYLLVDAIHMTVCSNNMWMLPVHINKGDLDYYLVRPVSSMFFLCLREFAANSFLNLLIAGGLLTWAIARYPTPLGTLDILLFLILLLNGTFIYWMLHMLFTIPVFWLHSGEGIRQLFFSLNTFSERPHQIFSDGIQRILTTILPLALIVSYPTYLLLEGFQAEMLLTILIVTPTFFLFILFLWSRALRAYSSASS